MKIERSNIFYIFPLVLAGISVGSFGASNEAQHWGQYFQEHEAKGTIVILDARSEENRLLVYNEKRANERFSPASTFKIPHTLFALDAGAVTDEFEVFEWDGVERSFSGHNSDQNLRSAMRSSTIWVYQAFAKAIGEDQAQDYLRKINYGNMDVTSEDGDYWVYGELEISAFEQIQFLQKLYQNQLLFEVSSQRLVKDLIIVEAGRHWILRAKTGWTGSLGWWVGWVEWPSGPVYFALNIDTPNRFSDLSKREAIAKEILRSYEALP